MILEGKVALITGAGSGIGKATARVLVQAGARVALLDRSLPDPKEVGGEIDPSQNPLHLLADISRPEQVRRAVEQAVETFGRLDVVVANAGINGVRVPIASLEPDEWDTTLAINLKGTFLTLKYTVPHMMGRGGSIIIISSINGTRTFSLALKQA